MKFEPVFFERNRVRRVYTGGKLFHGFFGDEAIDNFMPEEWVASSVKALNKDSLSDKEGLSKILGSDVYFDELLAKHPLEMLGASRKMRILVKILDSAVRLPAQAHPDKDFSRKFFNSEYGKTESWIILDTRPNAKIFFGFKKSVDKQTFEKAIDDSQTNKNAMEELMEYCEPKVGDVFLVPAKTVHAIGAGCLLLEVQEPTDFTIQPEHWCDEYKLNDKEVYMGLSKEEAVSCFNFGETPKAKIYPKVIYREKGIKLESLIDRSNTDCFVINRLTLENAEYLLNINDGYGVYIVTNGEGKLYSKEGYLKQIKKGDYFFMPACRMGKFSIEGNIEVIECY